MDSRTGLPIVGLVGAGQLARMTHQAGISLGLSVRVLAETPDDGAALVTPGVQVGDYRSLEDLRVFARGCDVVSFDHEHVRSDHIRALIADGANVYPGADALRYAQNKRAMRERLGELGIPCPPWRAIDAASDLVDFGAAVGWPLVVKAATGGYDGKGVWTVDDEPAGAALVDRLRSEGVPVLAEQRVPIARELAAVVARSPFGQGAAWPVVETVQRDGICVEVVAPAPELDDERADEAQRLALRVAASLGVVGVLAVELFEDADGCLLVNELAMRPHNSAHWTIEGSRTSQFEQHLRAVLDYPLGTTTTTAPVTVMVNLLGGPDDVVPKSLDERVHHCLAGWPDVKIHLYGKSFRPGRKVGHVTALGTDLASVRERARGAAAYLMNGDASR
ncbi:MAG: 5-(carboxyamino)imidazole ribonucleotide synthase [Actinobacteria bacterium]|nr:5-(carboxyamino)imidazole ribonucleotide synthase [Actinomycetota bacterium]